MDVGVCSRAHGVTCCELDPVNPRGENQGLHAAATGRKLSQRQR